MVSQVTQPATGALDFVTLVKRLYDLEMAKNLDAWMEMWDPTYVITFPFATHPSIAPIRGLETLRDITRQKFIDRIHIELDVHIEPLADPLKALVHLGVAHTQADGSVRKLPLLCLFSFNTDGRIVAMEEFFNQATLS
jgi:ketosteroid isomerase-like protein